MPRSRLTLIFALVMLVLSGTLLAFTLIQRSRPAVSDAAASGATIGGPFQLVATTGATVTDQTYRGKWMLIYFGYTFCPDACPTALNNMTEALEKLGPDADKLQPLFITVDPKRDTVEVMREYLKSFDPRIVGLTGSPEQVERAAKAYRVYAAPEPGKDEDYLVAHSAYLYLMGPGGKFVDVLAGDMAGEQMADRLRSMLKRPTS